MSTSEQLASAIAAVSALRQTYADKATEIDAATASLRTLVQTAAATAPNLLKTFYVNAVTGADTNDGTASTRAFKTLTAALSASNIAGAQVSIYLSDGVYDLGGFTAQHLSAFLLIGGSGVNKVTVNTPQRLSMFCGTLRVRGLTWNKTSDITQSYHMRAPFSFYYGGNLLLGLFISGLVSETNADVKLVLDSSPIVNAENSSVMVVAEGSLIENISSSIAEIIATNRGIVLYRLLNCVTNNFTLNKSTLVSIGVANV